MTVNEQSSGGEETEPAKKLTLTLHLLTVETYMKKRDLKLDSAADRDRQERGGRDSRGGMRRGRQTLGTCFWDELRFDSLFF